MRENAYAKVSRHPFWTYLTYDHYVTWAKFAADFISDHPQSIKNYHVVGCLWAELNANGLKVEKKYDNNFVEQDNSEVAGQVCAQKEFKVNR